MKQLSRKEERELRLLCGSNFISIFVIYEEVKPFKDHKIELNQYNRKTKWILERNRLIDLLEKKFGDDVKAAHVFWYKIHSERFKARSEYWKTPRKVRKDNKTEKNYGSSGSNRNKIRYPKKCRKTAWKRFYKLFPHLQKKKNKNK